MSIRDDNILSDAEHLYAEDLGGKEVTLTIREIVKEPVRGGGSGKADRRFTIHFAETPKKYVPGIGVRRALARLAGTTDRHALVGCRVTLYPTTCDAFGERGVPCIRLRNVTRPKSQPAQPAAPATDQQLAAPSGATDDDFAALEGDGEARE
jgi:hypothetical protein